MCDRLKKVEKCDNEAGTSTQDVRHVGADLKSNKEKEYFFNSRTGSLRKTPQGWLYLDKSIHSLSQQRTHVASRKTQIYFMNPRLVKISAFKTLYKLIGC